MEQTKNIAGLIIERWESGIFRYLVRFESAFNEVKELLEKGRLDDARFRMKSLMDDAEGVKKSCSDERCRPSAYELLEKSGLFDEYKKYYEVELPAEIQRQQNNRRIAELNKEFSRISGMYSDGLTEPAKEFLEKLVEDVKKEHRGVQDALLPEYNGLLGKMRSKR